MTTRPRLLATLATLALLAAAACGPAEDPTNLLPPTGTCRLAGAVTASIPVGATAAFDAASQQWLVSLNGESGTSSFVGDVWIGPVARAGSYTLATAGAMTFFSVFDTPAGTSATHVWMAGSLSPEIAPAGMLQLDATAVGDVTHGTLTALLPPDLDTGALGEVSVTCAF